MTPDNRDGRDHTTAEDELLRLVHEQGSAQAAAELVLRYFPELERLVAWVVRKERLEGHDVEDVVQATFLKLLAAVRKYARGWFAGRYRCRLRTYLGTEAVHRARDAARHLRCCRQHEAQAPCSAAEATAGAAATAALHWLAPPAVLKDDPVLVAEQREALAGLDDAVARLSAEDRQVLQNSRDGISPQETAVLLDVSASTVHRRLDSIVCRLRDQIGSRY